MLGQGQIKNEEDRSSSVVVVAPSLPLLDAMSGEARQSKQAGKQASPGPILYIPSTKGQLILKANFKVFF